jgi:triacylglycerol lipase
VATVSLAPPYTSIGKLVPQLNRRIEEVCAATGAKQVTLIGHSMGGLVCRSYLSRHGIARVARLITLATPHAGTELGRIGFGQNAREMEPGSLWLNDMAREAVKIPAISLRNPYDNYVMPQDNQRLAGARDIELPAVGHLAMLYDERVARLLLDLCPPPGKTA